MVAKLPSVKQPGSVKSVAVSLLKVQHQRVGGVPYAYRSVRVVKSMSCQTIK
jgi:hypothetical protein